MSKLTEMVTDEERLLRDIRVAARQVTDLIGDIAQLQEAVRAGEAGAVADSQKRLADLRGWLKRAYELEDIHEQRHHGRKGGGDALDLDAARLAIGGRLARLRAAGGAAGVSGQPE